jgi:signal transduction histidine kinase
MIEIIEGGSGMTVQEEEIRGDIELQVNGKSVGMNPFVKSVFYRVILGLVSSLKKTDDASEIVIRLKREG